MADRKYFVDVFSDVVAEVRAEYDPINNLQPYYMFGHPKEIAHRLTLKEKGSLKFNKYPLIALLTDFEETHMQTQDISYSVSPTILILNPTNKNYNSEERYINTFKTILYPIYELLIDKIAESKIISTKSRLISHTKIDRLYWGVNGINGNEGLIFNDILDGIELNIDTLDIYIKASSCESATV